jgi:hypothetical protein
MRISECMAVSERGVASAPAFTGGPASMEAAVFMEAAAFMEAADTVSTWLDRRWLQDFARQNPLRCMASPANIVE